MCAQQEREFDFFSPNDLYGDDDYDIAYLRNFNCTGEPVVFAKSVAVMYSEKAMRRLRDHNPGVEIVLLLRDPVNRAYSDFLYARRKGIEPISSFDDAIWASPSRFGRDRAWSAECAYLERGEYASHIVRLQSFFPETDIRIFLFEDFVVDPASICRDIWELFPSLDQGFIPDFSRRYNPARRARWALLSRLMSSRTVLTSTKNLVERLIGRSWMRQIGNRLRAFNERPVAREPMSPETRRRLSEYYAPHNRVLADQLRRDLREWDHS